MRTRLRATLGIMLAAGGIVTAATPAAAVSSAPAVPPTVESSYFVENSGPPGVTGPGEFTFTANGVADVVRFDWTGIGVPDGSVTADQPGGSATVTIMPTSDGPVSISVASVDADGFRSDARTYRFWVASNAPQTSLTGRYYFGQRVPVTLTATQADAVTFTYWFEAEDGQPEHTLPVGTDGTASLTIDLPRGDVSAFDFVVWTTTATGQRSQVNTEMVSINAAAPEVGFNPREVDAGQPTTLFINPDFFMGDDLVSYTWSINNGPENTVAPAADGTARLTYVPTEPGEYFVLVYANYANGGISGRAFADLYVR